MKRATLTILAAALVVTCTAATASETRCRENLNGDEGVLTKAAALSLARTPTSTATRLRGTSTAGSLNAAGTT